MSSRLKRVTKVAEVSAFAWGEAGAHHEVPAPFLGRGGGSFEGHTEPERRSEIQDERSRMAELEREAFATAYAQGERAGVEAGTKRADAMLRRLSDTLRELDELRRSMIRQTEHQIVQLAVEMARRILRREVQVDNDLLCAMARVALDRLGDAAPATIRLNPEDYHSIVARQGGSWAGNHVTVVADPAVGRGGCMVESSFGFVDASVEAQFRVLEDALLADDGARVVEADRGRS